MQPERLVEAPDLEPHLQPELRVEVAERFVEEQEPRLDHERAGQRDALLLAAAHLRGVAIAEMLEMHQRESLRHAARDRVARDPQHLQPERDVPPGRHMRKERVVLEHHPKPAAFGRHPGQVEVVEHNRPGVGLEQPRDTVERR